MRWCSRADSPTGRTQRSPEGRLSASCGGTGARVMDPRREMETGAASRPRSDLRQALRLTLLHPQTPSLGRHLE